MAILNEKLASKQKITDKQRDNLQALYEGLDMLISTANADDDIKTNGPSYAADMKVLEFNLQKNWNFPLHPLFHTWWNRFMRCSCPKMDNSERLGMDKIIDSRCPFHGTEA